MKRSIRNFSVFIFTLLLCISPFTICASAEGTANCDMRESAAVSAAAPDLSSGRTRRSTRYAPPAGGGHNYVKTELPATCTEDGYIKYICTYCHDVYSEEVIPALGHDWGEWETQTQPTCVSDGVSMRVCMRDPTSPHYEYAVIPATGEHSYVRTETPATCTEDREAVYTCSVCGDSYTETLPAPGHEWGDWAVEIQPTCASEGRRVRVCTRDAASPHYECETIPATGAHSYVRTETPATCTEDGVVEYTCSVCGDSYTETLPATGHDWGEWITDEAATGEHTGLRHRVCRRDDGHVEQESIPMEVSAPDGGAPNALDYALTAAAIFGAALSAMSLAPGINALSRYERKKRDFTGRHGKE